MHQKMLIKQILIRNQLQNYRRHSKLNFTSEEEEEEENEKKKKH
jgi:hypothetical protein